jgi:hypothetical protein
MGAVAALLSASALAASGPAGLDRAEVGQWVVYRLDGGPGRVSYLRLAVVGRDVDELGRDAVWLELELGLEPELRAPLAQMCALVSRALGLTPEGVSRLLLAQGASRPQEVAPGQIRALWPAGLSGPSASPGSPLSISSGGRATLQTAAGPIEARAIEIRAGDRVVQRFWTSAAVPLTALVRVELLMGGQNLDLQGFGAAATRRMLPIPAPRRSIGPEQTGDRAE